MIDESSKPARLNLDVRRAWESRGAGVGLPDSGAGQTAGQPARDRAGIVVASGEGDLRSPGGGVGRPLR